MGMNLQGWHIKDHEFGNGGILHETSKAELWKGVQKVLGSINWPFLAL